MKTILITGATGFIGSFLVEQAIKQGYKVFAGIRASSSRAYLNDFKVEYFEIDFSDKQSMKQKLLKHIENNGLFDYIIHNAGLTKTLHKQDFFTVNYQYTKNFVEALIETRCVPQKFVFISSLAAYGPGDDASLRPINESDIPNPVTFYGESKLRAEQFITSQQDFPYLIFRPTGVYGPREKDYFVMYKMIHQHIETYIGTTDQHITFVYVKDLARVIIQAAVSDISRKAWFVSDGKNYTTLQFSNIVKSLLHKKTIRLVFPKALVKPIAYSLEKIARINGKVPTLNTEKYKEISCKNWLCDSSTLFRDLEFTPEYDLTRGLSETLAWCKHEKLL